MTLRLAWRSLTTRPVRSAVLAGGFGLGITVMAVLLGVGEVILEQARSPDLHGGGHVVLSGPGGRVDSARYVLAHILGAPPLVDRVAAASPRRDAIVYLVRDGGVVAVEARGGIPSLERRAGDPETAAVEAWRDTPADRAWTDPDPAELLRAMDRFHPVPAAPARLHSWAEWLYFNGQAGETRFYLTFLVEAATEGSGRPALVRLQLERGGTTSNFSERAVLDAAAVASAPDLTVGRSRVRLDGLDYRIALDLAGEPGAAGRLRGEIVLTAAPGRSLPPQVLRGAGGWVSGYVVPVLAGDLAGEMRIDGTVVSLDGGRGYHDHNWGFWEDVTWQWGQAAGADLSVVYGRVRPPSDAADPGRIPGFLGVFGPAGPAGFALAEITEEDGEDGRPRRIVVRGSQPGLELVLELEIRDMVSSPLGSGPFRALTPGRRFLQMQADYVVRGRIGDRRVEFAAKGAAETFRER